MKNNNDEKVLEYLPRLFLQRIAILFSDGRTGLS